MGTRTVRLDEESERLLARVCDATGLSVSAVLKRGLVVVSTEIANGLASKPYEVYRRLDLGPGGYAIAPARNAKSAVRDAIRRKHGRR